MKGEPEATRIPPDSYLSSLYPPAFFGYLLSYDADINNHSRLDRDFTPFSGRQTFCLTKHLLKKKKKKRRAKKKKSKRDRKERNKREKKKREWYMYFALLPQPPPPPCSTDLVWPIILIDRCLCLDACACGYSNCWLDIFSYCICHYITYQFSFHLTCLYTTKTYRHLWTKKYCLSFCCICFFFLYIFITAVLHNTHEITNQSRNNNNNRTSFTKLSACSDVYLFQFVCFACLLAHFVLFFALV